MVSHRNNYANFEVPYYGTDNDDYVNGQGFCCDDTPRLKSFDPSQNDNPELFQYYYHSDHLGSSSLITNLDGEVVQHIEYVPFGEVFIEERNNTWNTPYLFNAKELDEETGLYYYGARYYDPRISLWLSVDPLQEKYPNVSTYIYCSNSPVNRIDPDGMDDIYGAGGKFIQHVDNKTDNIIIRYENTLKQNLVDNGVTSDFTSDAFKDFVNAMPDYFDVGIEKAELSAEAYSNIFTDVLSKSGDDIKNLYNGAVSVKVYDKNDKKTVSSFNNPNKQYSMASTGIVDEQIRATANIHSDSKPLLNTVSNVQNMLGEHEYTAHGVKGYSNKTYTHYKAYDYQMRPESKTWNKTTPYYKQYIRSNAKDYDRERSR